ncbi:MAG: hypothetical protein ACKV2O_14725 [Acidimicrobiales bacterium]
MPLDADPPRLTLPLVGGGHQDLATDLDLINEETLATAKTAVWFERDGVLLNAGILWTVRADIGANTLELAGEGPHSYWRRRNIRQNVTHTAVDQLTIAKSLIDTAQAVPNGTIGVVVSSVLSGYGRNRVWKAYERKNLGEALEQLGNLNYGFDWRYDTNYVGGIPTSTLQFTYPATGRVTAHVFEVGTNCSMLTYEEDGSAIANTVDALGAGEGDDALIVTVANAPMIGGGYPILEDVTSFGDVREFNALEDHARRRLARGAGPIRRVALDTFPDVEPTLGSYVIGDQVRVVADHGRVQLSDLMRIVEMTVTVSGGSEAINLSLAGIESFGFT